MEKRKSGILLHPTSLPSPYGIGDIGKNAYNFIDFLKKSGQSLWQVLPLGPTGFGNSPYQSYSAFAGNYYLISPESLYKEGLLSKNDIDKIPLFPDSFTDYPNVIEYKMSLFKKAYENFLKTDYFISEYKSFKKSCSHWLDGCCLFAAAKDYYIENRKNEFEPKALKDLQKLLKGSVSDNTVRDYYYGGVWATWDESLKNRIPEAVEQYKLLLSDKIEFYSFLQFMFYRQWGALKDYANRNGIGIIGDIPIFTAWDSADVWENPNLFDLDKNGFPAESAGVPPDYFSPKGQLWGTPLYNWSQHKKTGYSWWISRIKNCLKLADTIRIDHFRGFESFYCIPKGMEDATVGKWRKGPGTDFFAALKKELKSLPFIAEDLGIITPEVTSLRLSAGLPGMKILQFAFDDSTNNSYLPHNYEKNCVVYTGTHDNDTTRGWYESAPEYSRDYMRRYMITD